MTVRDAAELVRLEVQDLYAEDHLKDEARIDRLCLLVKRLAELVMACAPEFKEAP